jgi:hypothetical protein
MENDKLIRTIVDEVLRELGRRKGFSNWWYDVYPEDRQDIIECAKEKVRIVLDTNQWKKSANV